MYKLSKLILYVSVFLFCDNLWAQNVKYQTDKHVVNQQERMVFKQWDRKKFTPTRGFLSLNYQYWLTWGLHPNYPKTDLRPLSGSGPQTRRLLLVAAMKNTQEAYKRHADTLRNTALSETANYAGVVSSGDPLWLLYYRHEFKDLLEFDEAAMFEGLDSNVRDFLEQGGSADWYREEAKVIGQRLEASRTTNLDRGARIIAYHRMLGEYRKLLAIWESKRQRAKTYLAIKDNIDRVKQELGGVLTVPKRSDIQIADDILSSTKL